MKHLIFLTLFSFCCLPANSQNFLQNANACFDNGDYECAKMNYKLFQTLDGSDMSAQIQKADKCLKSKTTADAMFGDKSYAIAQTYYKKILEINPKDPYAKRQYDLCMSQLGSSASSSSAAANSRFANYTETANNLNLEMVAVQGETFTMGCTSEQGSECYDNEKPAHQVTVGNFYIGKYPITVAQFRKFVTATNYCTEAERNGGGVIWTGRRWINKSDANWQNPYFWQTDNDPVVLVSWNDTQKYMEWLNQASGKQYRLLTEAEWEFASRGGAGSRGYKYSGSNNPNDVAGTRTTAITGLTRLAPNHPTNWVFTT